MKALPSAVVATFESTDPNPTARWLQALPVQPTSHAHVCLFPCHSHETTNMDDGIRKIAEAAAHPSYMYT